MDQTASYFNLTIASARGVDMTQLGMLAHDLPFWINEVLPLRLKGKYMESNGKSIAVRYVRGPPNHFTVKTDPEITAHLLENQRDPIQAFDNHGNLLELHCVEREVVKKIVGGKKDVGVFKGDVSMPDIAGNDTSIKASLGAHFAKHRMTMIDARPLFQGETNNYIFKWRFEFEPANGFNPKDITAAHKVSLGNGFVGSFHPSKELGEATSVCVECVKSTLPGAQLHWGEKCTCQDGYRLRGKEIAANKQAKRDARAGHAGRMAANKRKAERPAARAAEAADEVMRG